MEQNLKELSIEEINELDKKQLAMAEEVSKELECPAECQNLGTNRRRYLAVRWYLGNEENTSCTDFEDDLRAGDYANILDQTIMKSIDILGNQKLKENGKDSEQENNQIEQSIELSDEELFSDTFAEIDEQNEKEYRENENRGNLIMEQDIKELKFDLITSEDKKLKEQLINWDLEIMDLFHLGKIQEYDKHEQLDILGFRAKAIAAHYFNNLQYAIKEIAGKFTYDECDVLFGLTRGLVVGTEHNKQMLIRDLENCGKFDTTANKDDVNSLIPKIEGLTEMQVHAVYYLCNRTLNDDNNPSKNVINKYFNVKQMEEIK